VIKLFSGNGRRFRFLPVIFFIYFSSAYNSSLLSAEPNDIAGDATQKQKISGGYCGIYCLYGAMRFLGRDCDPNELIKQEYIGSTKGSSLAELQKAAESHGLYAAPVKRLSTKDLRRYQLPVILHVKSSPIARTYDHYELFLGAKEDEALLYDPPRPIESVPFRTLAPIWDGSALIVSDKPIDLGALFGPARLRFAMYAALAAAAVIAVRWGRQYFFRSRPALNRRKTLLLSLGQCVVLILTAAAGAIAYNSINEEGLLAFKKAIASIQQAHQANFIPKLSGGELRRLLINSQAVFIDPRPEFFFKTNHLKDAINIPPGTTGDALAKITGRIDKNAPVVVYCLKADYQWAGDLAVKLLSDGFTSVRIYKGNRIKWSTFKKQN